MEKNFAKLLDENLDTLNFEIGKLITGNCRSYRRLGCYSCGLKIRAYNC